MWLERLEQQLRKRHHGKWYGDIQSFFLWSGTHIEDFRVYASGDSPRNINRKLSAKHDGLWVNMRTQDADLPVHIILDINANRLGWIYEQNRSIVRQRIADYILFSREHHVWKTMVRFPWIDGSIQCISCTTHEQWLQWYTHREKCVRSTKKYYTSILQIFLSQQKQHRKQVFLFFSDFLSTNSMLEKKLSYLDQENAVMKVCIDVPEFLDQYLI